MEIQGKGDPPKMEENQPFKCDFPSCDYRATNKKTLSSHVFRRHGTKHHRKVYTCDQCDYKTSEKQSIRQHAVTHSDERPFVCNFPLCNYRAKLRNHLSQHKKIHEPNELKNFVCTYCSQRFRFKVHLDTHIRTHTGDKPYACGFSGCNYRARNQGGLQCHRRKHDPNSMFECEFPGCEFQTNLTQSLKNHQETHNPERQKDLQCPLCSAKFAVACNLRHHIVARHTNERPFTCKTCGINFSHMYRLHRHKLAAHPLEATEMKTVARKYKCTACNFHSKSKSKVLEHQQAIHSNTRDFACDKCEYRAKCKSHVRSHQSRCPGLPRVRSFECEECKKKFFTQRDLKVHLNGVHRPDKPYKCLRCDFVTTCAVYLRKHLKSQHSEKAAEGQVTETDSRSDQKNESGRRPLHATATTTECTESDVETFKCKFPGCSFATIYRENVKYHERRHRPEMKTFHCPLCPWKFFEHYELNRHIRCAHAKEKPFSCDICEHTASSAFHIREHRRRVHERKATVAKASGDEPKIIVPAEQLGIVQIYSCPFCDSTHEEYMSMIRHTVWHRSVVVSLERLRLITSTTQ